LLLSLLLTHLPPRSPLFPYTTLFRSFLPLSHKAEVMSDECGMMNDGQAAFNSSFIIPHSAFDSFPDPLARLLRRESAAEVARRRSEEHTSELQSPYDLVCRLLLEKKN